MSEVFIKIREEREYRQLLHSIDEGVRFHKGKPLQVTGLCEGATLAVLTTLLLDYKQKYGHGALIFVPDERRGKNLSAALARCGLLSYFFPERDFVFYNMTSSREFEQERLQTLVAVSAGRFDAVIATLPAALQITLPPDVLAKRVIHIQTGDTLALDALCEAALACGYTESEMVDAPGLFSKRGGLFDIYVPGVASPYRIEFFGDEVDSISLFDPESQRRTEPQEVCEIIPAKEVLLDDAAVAGVNQAMARLLADAKKKGKALPSSERFAIESGEELPCIDRFIDYVYENKQACLLDYFERDSLFVLLDRAQSYKLYDAFEWHLAHQIESLLEEGLIESQHAVYAKTKADFEHRFYAAGGVFFDAFASEDLAGAADLFTFHTKQTVSYAGRLSLLAEDIKNYFSAGFAVEVVCENEISVKHVKEFLQEQGIASVSQADSERPQNCVLLCTNALSDQTVKEGFAGPGFELSDASYVLLSLTDQEAVRSKPKRSKKKGSKSERILSYADLTEGDYVVHANHGIGRYVGLQTMTVDGVTKDFVKIQYAGTDALYLPCSQLDLLSKYIGDKGENGQLKLSKIGGTEWHKTKARVKAAAKEMAGELIKLYAKRTRQPGFAYGPDDEFQEEFEAAFPYEETEGQTIAVAEIKEDMEKSCPMDRLLCGDVGFGKTEVAMRAAFKAAMNNKQVAMLVPTTILAMQHYQTFTARMRGFPIRIEMLSRFRTAKQQADILKNLKNGKIDIIIATHRLLSSDIAFRDLGLFIVDEEQRFGVAHKEKLKQISGNVDVLTLSATPIPRTLNMAMSGIRDMSILEEAPENRLPVQTFVLEYDDLMIESAINKELRRGGQVFYLCNNIERLDLTVRKIKAMAPQANIVSAHGRMEREEISEIWGELLSGAVDILVSTTIIESGVDVPNANTLIIENADRFGLSQLHQIRGRVGRSSRRAYAYFTYPKQKVLSEVATKRLSAIREYTEFGSGFRIALRDLEIRGAGNILGAEQHGHMESVGYDLYMKLLNEAILEEKDEAAPPMPECTVEYGKSAYIPERYIKSASGRISAYRKIAEITTEEDRSNIIDELIDRYGDLPASVYTLIGISLLRALGARCGITKIDFANGCFTMQQNPFHLEAWIALAAGKKNQMRIGAAGKPCVAFKPHRTKNAFDEAIVFLEEYMSVAKEAEKSHSV
ncbi:MAG: transcription-repair coupling factor [Clostridiales bacterium]|nr:transcription-repair coupling factor [Clostridiales bacterium]